MMLFEGIHTCAIGVYVYGASLCLLSNLGYGVGNNRGLHQGLAITRLTKTV